MPPTFSFCSPSPKDMNCASSCISFSPPFSSTPAAFLPKHFRAGRCDSHARFSQVDRRWWCLEHRVLPQPSHSTGGLRKGVWHKIRVLGGRKGLNDSWRMHAYGDELPSQADAIVGGAVVAESEFKAIPDMEYLQELLAIQQQGPTAIGFFGTRNMAYTHQQLIEILSYAMVITKNHIYTSGASGTNAAVIRGALRAERPDLLTVILPQSLKKQPPESQELLSKVQKVIEMPHNDHLSLIEASRICNMNILSHVQQVICFAFHDSRLLLETCSEAKIFRKIVTLFYLD